MKGILSWIKGNPLTTAAVIVVVVSVIGLSVVSASGRGFVERMSARGKEISRLKMLQRTPVKVPPAKPDQPERRLNIAVNQAAIDQLARVYKLLNQEAVEIFKSAVQQNQRYHDPMLPGLFPDPLEVSKPFEVKDVYRDILTAMLGLYEADSTYPRLNAGVPPTQSDIMGVIKKAQTHYLASFFPPKQSLNELTEEEEMELEEVQREKLIDFIQSRAQNIHIYADTNIDSQMFPFDVGRWSEPGPRPLMSEVWEGQIGLWIQRDIVAAIAQANAVENKKRNVIDAPVKRLIKIRVVPGYVGLRGARGGLADDPGAVAPGAEILNPGIAVTAAGLGGDGAQPSDDFSVSPTGRRSNAAYDVRHVKLSLIVDSEKLPAFFTSLHGINLMTILKMDITAEDEYAALREGYFYGAGDTVRVDLLIETIWLRDWTAKLMPSAVRNMLGVQIPTANDNDMESTR